MRKYIYSILAIVFGTLLGACSEDKDKAIYNLNTNEDYVSFRSETLVFPLDPNSESNELFVDVIHLNTKIEGTTATIKLNNAPNFVTFKETTIAFKKGEAIYPVSFTYDKSKMEPGVDYKFSISLQGPNTTYPTFNKGDTVSLIYKKLNITLNIDAKKLNYRSIGMGEWYSGLYEQLKCEFEKADGYEFYRMIEPIEKNQRILFTIDTDNKVTLKRQIAKTGGYNGNNITVEGTGTRNGKTININILYYVPEIEKKLDWKNDVITLP